MACDNHYNRKERAVSPAKSCRPQLPDMILNDRGSTAFYIVLVIFMAVVVYFKFYYTPVWDTDKPLKITAPRRKAVVSFGPSSGVQQAKANEAASMQVVPTPAVVSLPKDGNAFKRVDAGNKQQAESKGALPADKRRGEPNASEAGGYKVVVLKRAEDVEAEKGMYSKEGSHFTVKFDGGENGVDGHVIAILLEEAYIKVGADLNFYPTDRIEAVLYTKDQFRDVTRSPAWAGELYDGG